MENIGPTLSFTVPNKIDDKGQNVPIELKFNKLSDFGPMAIVNQVDKIRETYERKALFPVAVFTTLNKVLPDGGVEGDGGVEAAP